VTYQEILEEICENRANPIDGNRLVKVSELKRKFSEIEWALQALAERLRDDHEDEGGM
jgi:hypothetical protein